MTTISTGPVSAAANEKIDVGKAISQQTIHRIYTEDKRRATIVRAIAKQFKSFTLQPTTGYYRGKPEKSIVLEIVGANESQVKWLAARIREINRQASVLVITLNGRAEKITANQQ